MSKLNPIKATSVFEPGVKLGGGMGMQAAKQPAYQQLRRLVLTGLLWEDSYYVNGQTASEQILEICKDKSITAQQLANLAIECRKVQKLRHMPLYLYACALKVGKADSYNVLQNICTRPDMMTDFLAIYKKLNGHIKPLAKQAKKGLAESFKNFDEYQLAKYNRAAEIKLRDVLRLVHPTPDNSEQSDLWKRLLDDKLAVPETWEVGLSAAKSDEDKREVWINLINNNKIGGLAFLRNLRNMTSVNVPASVIRQGFQQLHNSMLLPLNFIMAAEQCPDFTKEIEDAMLACYAKIPKLPGKTLLVVDRSGSMGSKLSDKSKFTRQTAANALALLAVNTCEDCNLVITAGSDGNWTHTSVLLKYPQRGFGLLNEITKAPVGHGGIFTRQVLEWSYENVGKEFDRIIVISDSQDMDRTNKIPNPFGKRNYIVDVSSHKHGVNYKGKWTAEISGWSENFLTYIAAIEGIENQFVEE